MRRRVGTIISAVDETVATRRDTIEAFVQRSKRKRAVGIRQTFLQPGRGARSGAAVLSWFVRRKDMLGLDLLLLLTLMGRGARYGGHYINIQSGVWTRALGRDGEYAAQQLSRALRRLEGSQLIKRAKTRKGVRVELRKEDASGAPYGPPGGGPNDLYFQLPLAYWLDDHYMKLSLRGKAMLLVALGEAAEFELPVAQVPKFYGVSSETAADGFDELVRRGLALYEVRSVKDPMAPLGKRSVKFWRLQPPYERSETEAPAAAVRIRRLK